METGVNDDHVQALCSFVAEADIVIVAGDICAITGIPDVKIGETIVDPENPIPLPTISVEEPTVTMTFMVNTSPFAGQEGKFVTSRNIKERLDRELEKNIALKVTRGQSADTFVVSGRGGLHLGILIETMRREGYEFAVGPMMVRDLLLMPRGPRKFLALGFALHHISHLICGIVAFKHVCS